MTVTVLRMLTWVFGCICTIKLEITNKANLDLFLTVAVEVGKCVLQVDSDGGQGVLMEFQCSYNLRELAMDQDSSIFSYV